MSIQKGSGSEVRRKQYRDGEEVDWCKGGGEWWVGVETPDMLSKNKAHLTYCDVVHTQQVFSSTHRHLTLYCMHKPRLPPSFQSHSINMSSLLWQFYFLLISFLWRLFYPKPLLFNLSTVLHFLLFPSCLLSPCIHSHPCYYQRRATSFLIQLISLPLIFSHDMIPT